MAMITERIAFVVALSLVAVVAMAQIDEGPDGIGIYFDESATAVSAEVAQDSSIVAYLVLTRPSLLGDLVHWEARVTSGFPGAAIFGAPIQGQNLAMNMPGSSAWTAVVSLDGPSPYPVATITVLAQLTVLPYFYGDPTLLLIDEGAFYAVSSGAINEGLPMNPASGSWSAPVAVINGAAPVPSHMTSWGRVKAEFR